MADTKWLDEQIARLEADLSEMRRIRSALLACGEPVAQCDCPVEFEPEEGEPDYIAPEDRPAVSRYTIIYGH